MKKVFLNCMLLLCALIVGSNSLWATDATFNWASGGNMGSNATGKVGSITLTGAANSASNAPAVTSNTLRVYAHRSSGNGASATFTTDDGYKISAIEVTSSNGGTILKYSADGGDYTTFSWTDGVATVSDLNVSSITLKNCQNSGKSNTTIQVSQVVITYASSSSTPSSDVAFEYSARSLDLNDALSFTQTATTADGYAEEDGASVTYSMTSNTAGATINSSTGEVTPTKAGSVTIQASAAAIDGKYLASSATYTLTVTDTREWDVTCHIGNNTSVESRTSGSALSLDNPAAICGMSFVGWSSTNNIASPTWVANTTKVTNNMELYAIFEEKAGEYSYHLVESNLGTAWAGDYLIAYSSTIFADGRKGGKDNAGEIGKAGVSVNPGDNLSGKVVDSEWGDTYNVTLEEISSGSNTYVLKTKDGKYNYQTSNSNGLVATENKSTAAQYPISVSYASTPSQIIRLTLGGSAAGAVFQYNSGQDGYFRYYANGSQNEITLYKRTTDVTPIYSLGLTTTITIAEACTDGKGNYYATYSNSRAFIVPEGITVSAVKITNGHLDLDATYSKGDVVAANTGVLITSASAGDKIVALTEATGTTKDGNLLHPGDVTAEQMATLYPNCKYYKLALQKNGETYVANTAGFYWGATDGEAFDSHANKAYLAVPNPQQGAPAHYLLNEEEYNATSINDIEASDKAVKFIENGQIYILRDGITYDALGRKIR